MWKTRLALLAVATAILAGLALLFFVVLPLLKGPPPPKVANTPNLVVQVQGLSQLVTVKYVIEKIIKLESEPTLYGLLPGDRVIIVAHADVKAGVDLSQVRPDDLKVSDKNISLIIPPGRITDCYLDEKQTQIWEHKLALFHSFNKDLEHNARQQAIREIMLAAGNSGIQREALERAKTQLAQFFKALGFTEVDIRTRGEVKPSQPEKTP
jgi:hypothetical protein